MRLVFVADQEGLLPRKRTEAMVDTTTPQPAPKTIKGQKYVSPLGRHSQQTHRRAEERATASGFTTEKEQHADDRSTVEAEIDRVAHEKANQRAQNARGATPKA